MYTFAPLQIQNVRPSPHRSTGPINTAQVSEAFHSAEAEEWVAWADKKLMVLLYPNMTRSFAECWQALGYLNNVPAFGAFTALSARALGAFGMSMAHGKILKKYK